MLRCRRCASPPQCPRGRGAPRERACAASIAGPHAARGSGGEHPGRARRQRAAARLRAAYVFVSAGKGGLTSASAAGSCRGGRTVEDRAAAVCRPLSSPPAPARNRTGVLPVGRHAGGGGAAAARPGGSARLLVALQVGRQARLPLRHQRRKRKGPSRRARRCCVSRRLMLLLLASRLGAAAAAPAAAGAACQPRGVLVAATFGPRNHLRGAPARARRWEGITGGKKCRAPVRVGRSRVPAARLRLRLRALRGTAARRASPARQAAAGRLVDDVM